LAGSIFMFTIRFRTLGLPCYPEVQSYPYQEMKDRKGEGLQGMRGISSGYLYSIYPASYPPGIINGFHVDELRDLF
jgi:hypothetical protein